MSRVLALVGAACLFLAASATPSYAWHLKGNVYCDGNQNGLVDATDAPMAGVRKALLPEIKAVEGDTRQIRFVISTDGVDRDRDTIAVAGWQLDNFKRNPSVLWSHDYSALPVARAVDIGVTDGKLVSVAEFATREVYPFADTVYQMIRGGFLNAASVGFRPSKYVLNEERRGVDFLEQELLEFSVVAVPSNPGAIVEARSAGIDVSPLREWAETILAGEHGPGFWMARATLEAVMKAMAPHGMRAVHPIVKINTDTVSGLRFELVEPKARKNPDQDCRMGADCPGAGKEHCPIGADCPMGKGAKDLSVVELEQDVLTLDPPEDEGIDLSAEAVTETIRSVVGAVLRDQMADGVRQALLKATGRVD